MSAGDDLKELFAIDREGHKRGFDEGFAAAREAAANEAMGWLGSAEKLADAIRALTPEVKP